MAYDSINSFVVVVHTKAPPTDEEWNEYIEFNRANGVERGIVTRYLVVTEGGAPTARQRKLLHDALSPLLEQYPNVIRSAIVTPSTFVRGVANAMGLVNPIIRGFSPNEMQKAYAYLGVPSAYMSDIEEIIASLRASLRRHDA
ncbi:MAG: hypothetical protein L6Q76_19960 [Polyangiaceae bacterium]|nr:hypothetical protein [Polyangiaceae bacterium]